MRKTLVAAALLAGASGAAYAQSGVTIYGSADAGFLSEKVDGKGTTNGIGSGMSSVSTFGFRGQEDLGNGLKANFRLESQLNIDQGTNTGALFQRWAYVGLSGGFGEVRLGRQVNFGGDWTPQVVSPFGQTWSNASAKSTFNYANDDTGAGSRLSNAIYYTTPRLGGFQGGIGYSFAESGTELPGSSNNYRVITSGIRYDEGPLSAVLTYDQAQAPTGKRDTSNMILGASYDFGVARLYAGYGRARNLNTDPGVGAITGDTRAKGYVATGHTKDQTYSVGVSVPVGAGTILASYQRATESKIGGVSLAYAYYLSKRTRLYVLYDDIDFRNHTLNRDIGVRQIAVGMRHAF